MRQLVCVVLDYFCGFTALRVLMKSFQVHGVDFCSKASQFIARHSEQQRFNMMKLFYDFVPCNTTANARRPRIGTSIMEKTMAPCRPNGPRTSRSLQAPMQHLQANVLITPWLLVQLSKRFTIHHGHLLTTKEAAAT